MGRRRLFGLAAALGIFLLAIACATSDDPRDRTVTLARTPNVVIFLIDSLRADRLGAYGYRKPTSPHIDSLVADGVLFEDASAPAPWTLPSVVSLLLSALPCEHNVLIDGDKVAATARTLPMRLHQVGYNTASFFANPYAGALSGLDQAHDVARAMDTLVDDEVLDDWLGAFVPGPLAPGQRLGVEGDMADQIEGVEVLAQFLGNGVQRQALGLQFLDDRLLAPGPLPALEEVIEAAGTLLHRLPGEIT